VRALAVEKASNSLWVGTSSGVNEVDLATGKLRNTFTRKDGLANEYVFGIGIDAEGHKWFGTNAGGRATSWCMQCSAQCRHAASTWIQRGTIN